MPANSIDSLITFHFPSSSSTSHRPLGSRSGHQLSTGAHASTTISADSCTSFSVSGIDSSDVASNSSFLVFVEMGRLRSSLLPCITALGDGLVEVLTTMSYGSECSLQAFMLATIKEFLAKELKISTQILKLTNSHGKNSKIILVRELSASQVHKRLVEAASANPSTESLNRKKLMQLNSCINQKERFINIGENENHGKQVVCPSSASKQ